MEINIAQRRGALDNCNMKWNNIVTVECKINTITLVNFHFTTFIFLFSLFLHTNIECINYQYCL